MIVEQYQSIRKGPDIWCILGLILMLPSGLLCLSLVLQILFELGYYDEFFMLPAIIRNLVTTWFPILGTIFGFLSSWRLRNEENIKTAILDGMTIASGLFFTFLSITYWIFEASGMD